MTKQSLERKEENDPSLGKKEVDAYADLDMTDSEMQPEFSLTSTLNLYDISSYTFGVKEAHRTKELIDALKYSDTFQEKVKKQYSDRGMRRTVSGVLLVHNHRFPHVLLLQNEETGLFFLPGGKLRPGESDVDGLQRKLTKKLSPLGSSAEIDESWEICDHLSNWWSPDFTRHVYPYIPAHVTKPKGLLSVYSVALRSSFAFSVARNVELVAVPLYDIYAHPAKYGPVIASLPQLLSRLHMNYIT